MIIVYGYSEAEILEQHPVLEKADIEFMQPD
jgi:hypothetical protein